MINLSWHSGWGMSRKSRDPFSAMAEFEQQLEKALKPVADFQKQIDTINFPSLSLPAVETVLREAAESQARLRATIEKLRIGPEPEATKRPAGRPGPRTFEGLHQASPNTNKIGILLARR